MMSSGWAVFLGPGFQRLITLDIMLYGVSLMLEFITLVVLRVREPNLKREFRVPGGLPGAILAGFFPLVLLVLAIVKSGSETVLGMNAGIHHAGGASCSRTKFETRIPGAWRPTWGDSNLVREHEA